MSNLYIRFGVHKDREVLKKMQAYVSGICIPAHILAYTPDPTKAVIFYIQKPFFIDPMTYRYAESDISTYVVLDKKDKKNKFKPSIKKLTERYELEDFLQKRISSPLTSDEVDTAFVNHLSRKVLDLQKDMVNEKKESAIDRYADLLSALGKAELVGEKQKDHKPEFYLTPHFYFSSMSDPWFGKNLELACKMKEFADEDDEVVPVLLTSAENLDTKMLDVYKGKGFTKIAIWFSDLEERSRQTGEVQSRKLENYINFAIKAGNLGIELIALHSSYFSVVLSKFGVTSICHGLLHGEYKNKKAQVGGGAPPARYYIRSIHNFLPVTSTQRLFSDPRARDLLDVASAPCMAMIDGDPSKIFDVFESNVPCSQIHFLHARRSEISFVNDSTLQEITNQLTTTYNEKKDLVEQVSSAGYLDYLEMWAVALKNKPRT